MQTNFKHQLVVPLLDDFATQLFLNGTTPAFFSFIFILFNESLQFYSKLMQKLSIKYVVLGFKLTTFWLRVSSLNH